MRRASLGYTDDAGHGAVVGNSDLAARAPVVVVRPEGHIQGLVVLVATAQAATARALTAAVIVRDDVVTPVPRIVAGPYPGDRRVLGARRTAVSRASATAAQEPVDGTVPPVLAGLRVTGIGGGVRARCRRRLTACHRQERHTGAAEQQRSNTADEAAPRHPLRHVARQPFYQRVDGARHMGH